jgi:hypothetical protein
VFCVINWWSFPTIWETSFTFESVLEVFGLLDLSLSALILYNSQKCNAQLNFSLQTFAPTFYAQECHLCYIINNPRSILWSVYPTLLFLTNKQTKHCAWNTTANTQHTEFQQHCRVIYLCDSTYSNSPVLPDYIQKYQSVWLSDPILVYYTVNYFGSYIHIVKCRKVFYLLLTRYM